MAISVPAVSNATFTSTGGGDVTVTFPTTSMAAGDKIVIFGGHVHNSGNSYGPTTGSTGGWVELSLVTSSVNGFGGWYKVWDGAATSQVCFASGTSGDACAYGRIILRDAGGPDAVTTTAAGTTTNPNPAAITPATTGSAVLIAAESAVSDASPGTVANYTTVNGNVNTTRDMSLSMGYRLGLPGGSSENPAAWSTWSSSAGWQTITIAINPAVNYSLACAPGSFAVTGVEAPSTWTYGGGKVASTYTGQPAGLNVGSTVAAAPGAFVLTGQAAGLAATANFTLATTPGSFAFTGQASNLVLDTRMVAAPGVFTFTGRASGLVLDTRTTASPGAFTLTGIDLKSDTHLTAGVGSYILAGQDVILSYAANWSMAAEVGDFVFTGIDADLTALATLSLAAAPGSFALTGQDATLPRTVAIAPGSYTFTGQGAELLTGTILPIGPGAFTLTGADTAFDRAILPGVGNYTLTGVDANLLWNADISMSVDPGAFTFDGVDSILLVTSTQEDQGHYGGLGGRKKKFLYDRPYLAEYAEELRKAVAAKRLAEAEDIAETIVEIAVEHPEPVVQPVLDIANRLSDLDQMESRVILNLARTLVIRAKHADQIMRDEEDAEVLLLS